MLYMRVYNDIVNKIYSLQMKKGDKLPSLAAICKEYSVAYNTARAAVNLLYKNGFISKSQRKASVVIFDFQSPDSQDQYERFIAERKSAILDAYDVKRMLLPSILECSARRCSQALLDAMQESSMGIAADRADLCLNSMHRTVYEYLDALGNPLILSVLEITDTAFSTLCILLEKHRRRFDEICGDILPQYQRLCGAMAARDDKIIHETVYAMYHHIGHAIGVLLKQHECSAQEDGREDGAYYLTEHLYASVAFDLLEKILEGRYPRGGFLPSEAALCQAYGVSMSTVKKAIALIGEMGAVKTINGKGSMVTADPDKAACDAGTAQKLSAQMAGFFNALELLAIPMADVAYFAVMRGGQPGQTPLRERLEQSYAACGPSRLILLRIIDCIVECIHSNVLSNLYLVVKRRLIEGFYYGITRAFEQECRGICVQAIQHAHDAEEFAGTMRQIMRLLLRYSAQACGQMGLVQPSWLMQEDG